MIKVRREQWCARDKEQKKREMTPNFLDKTHKNQKFPECKVSSTG